MIDRVVDGEAAADEEEEVEGQETDAAHDVSVIVAVVRTVGGWEC